MLQIFCDLNHHIQSMDCFVKHILKVIVNDINKIWSLELVYVDKLAKNNHGYDI